jgi:hypothetical protein
MIKILYDLTDFDLNLILTNQRYPRSIKLIAREDMTRN